MQKKLSKEEFLDKIEEAAAKCERETHGCARCTLTPLMKYFELGDEASRDFLLKGVIPLSGGIVQKRNTCTAMVGGLMAMGIASFPNKKLWEDVSVVKESMQLMALGRKYYQEFAREVGHIRCFDIREEGLGRCFDTADPEEYDKFIKAGGYELCGKICGKAARLAVKYILQIREEQQRKD
jgi:hypothetical protein